MEEERQLLSSKGAIQHLREGGYPMPKSNDSARKHLLYLGKRGLQYVTTAGGWRRYRPEHLDTFLKEWRAKQPQAPGSEVLA